MQCEESLGVSKAEGKFGEDVFFYSSSMADAILASRISVDEFFDPGKIAS